MIQRNIWHPRELCLDCHFYKRIWLLGIWQCRFGLDPMIVKNNEGKPVVECFGFTVKHKDGKPIEEPAPAMRAWRNEALRIAGKPTEK